VALSPFNLNKSVSFLKSGFHDLTVRVCDAIDNCGEQKLEFNLTQNAEPEKTNLKISLTQPAANANFIKYDFPLILKASVSPAEQVAGVVFFLQDAAGNQKQLAQSSVKDKTAYGSLTEILTPGAYKLYAEARGWQGQTAKSNLVNITIKDMPAATAAATTTPATTQ